MNLKKQSATAFYGDDGVEGRSVAENHQCNFKEVHEYVDNDDEMKCQIMIMSITKKTLFLLKS